MDVKVTKDKPVDPEEMENEETKELRVIKVYQEKMAVKGKKETKVAKALSEILEERVSQEVKVMLVRRAPKVMLVIKG